MELHKVYRFGRCRYDARRFLLFRDDEEVAGLQPLHRNLLVYFLEHPQTVLSRATLHEVGWGGVRVERDALNRAISELRKHLGSPGRDSRYIRTVDGGGYEFIEEVEVENDAEDEAEAVSEDASAARAGGSPPVTRLAQASWKKWALLSLIVVPGLLAAVVGMLARKPRPMLESIDPAQPMSHIGDQPILLRGKNLGPWLTVRVIFPRDPGKTEMSFGELPTAAITWHDSTTATCLIDFNSRPFPHGLQLRHPWGLHSTVLPITVGELLQPPQIDEVAPKTLRPKNDNQLLIVYGTHFQQGPLVSLTFPDGSVMQLNPESVERSAPDVIRLHLYLRQEGKYEVQVRNNNGKTSAPFPFTVAEK